MHPHNPYHVLTTENKTLASKSIEVKTFEHRFAEKPPEREIKHTSVIISDLSETLCVFGEKGKMLSSQPTTIGPNFQLEKKAHVIFTTVAYKWKPKGAVEETTTTLHFTLKEPMLREKPVHIPELGIVLCLASMTHQIIPVEQELQNQIDVLQLDFNKDMRFEANPGSFIGEIPKIYTYDGIKMRQFPIVPNRNVEIGKVEIFVSDDALNLTGQYGLRSHSLMDITTLQSRAVEIDVETNLGVNKYFLSLDYQLITILARTDRKNPQFEQGELLAETMCEVEAKAKENPDLTLEETKLHIALQEQKKIVEEKDKTIAAQKEALIKAQEIVENLESENQKIIEDNEKLERELTWSSSEVRRSKTRIDDMRYDWERDKRENQALLKSKSHNDGVTKFKNYVETGMLLLGLFDTVTRR